MKKFLKRLIKILAYTLAALIGLILVFLIYYYFAVKIEAPAINVKSLEQVKRIKLNDSTFTFKQNFLRKNTYGIWEMYLQGSPEEIGYSHGVLSKELMAYQEKAFVDQIQKMIPNPSYLRFLKYVTAYMNRKLPEYIPLEYQKEIKAVSLSADSAFLFIGDNYERQLNYHAAHDIGHAMQNLNLVACTAFSVWDSLSTDHELLIGRNFDFYVGDEFAKNKVLMFIAPDSGYRFVSLAWAGMSGVVSGMNDQGLSVTLNAAKSDIPFTAKTPVSIIAREIIQYASNIKEAYTIARKRPSFVAETFFVGSAQDGKSAIIEKTPDTTLLFYNAQSSRQIATNHFQSPGLLHSKLNVENMENNATSGRYKRVKELLNQKRTYGLLDFVAILRDSKGLGYKSIGIGNELAVNQFIAYHSVIFKPEEKRLWVSTPPFQLGAYLPYSLDSVFSNPKILFKEKFGSSLISADSTDLITKYKSFLKYKRLKSKIELSIKNKTSLELSLLKKFADSNPEFFNTWEILGDYDVSFQQMEQAKFSYKKALECVIPNHYESQRIQNKLKKLEKSNQSE